MSVIQIKEDGTTRTLVAPDYKSGKMKLSDWQITAEMNENKPASLVIENSKGDAIEYNTKQSKIKGSTLIKSKGNIIDELIDELPDAAK